MKHVVITAGHSNADPGAVGGGTTEAAVVTDFRNMVAHYLREAGVAFTTDGTGDQNLPLSAAIKLVTPGSVAVEFHCNAAANAKATGVETLSRDRDKPLGAQICAAIADELGIANRGAKGESSGQHSRLGFVQAGGVIVELFFLSNPGDLAAYQAKKWLVAKAVARVLAAAAQ